MVDPAIGGECYLRDALAWCCLQVQSDVHVFGHSHINCDVDLPLPARVRTAGLGGRGQGGAGVCAGGCSKTRRYVQRVLDGHILHTTDTDATSAFAQLL
jgi:hypothetical protein